MRFFIKLTSALIVLSIFSFACSSSHQIACPDYSKNPKLRHTPAQAYKQTNYKPPKVKHKHKMGRVRTTSKQISSPNTQLRTNKEIEANAVQVPTMANVIQPADQSSTSVQSALEDINPEIGLSTGNGNIAELAESSDFKKLKFSAENAEIKASSAYEQTQTIVYEQSSVEGVDDASVNPPIVVKSRKEKRQVLRNMKRSINNYIEAEPGGEAKPVTGFAVAALVLGIVSLFVFPFVAGPLSIIFGGIALKRANSNPNKEGRGMAIAGLVCGIVGTVGGLILLFI